MENFSPYITLPKSMKYLWLKDPIGREDPSRHKKSARPFSRRLRAFQSWSIIQDSHVELGKQDELERRSYITTIKELSG